MPTQFDIVQDFQFAKIQVRKIRNQSVPDPTPDEIRERAAEIRKGWNETRWSKERKHLRQNRWTAPQVSVSRSLMQSHVIF